MSITLAGFLFSLSLLFFLLLVLAWVFHQELSRREVVKVHQCEAVLPNNAVGPGPGLVFGGREDPRSIVHIPYTLRSGKRLFLTQYVLW